MGLLSKIKNLMSHSETFSEYNKSLFTRENNFYEVGRGMTTSEIEKMKQHRLNTIEEEPSNIKHGSIIKYKLEDKEQLSEAVWANGMRGIVEVKVEKDPNGLSPNTPGAKLDYGKPDMDLVLGSFSRALLEVAKVGAHGAEKYSPNGWLSVPNGIKRYTSAELRHYFKEEVEGLYDGDSGLLHKAHKAWNGLAALELELRRLGDERKNPELGCSKE